MLFMLLKFVRKEYMCKSILYHTIQSIKGSGNRLDVFCTCKQYTHRTYILNVALVKRMREGLWINHTLHNTFDEIHLSNEGVIKLCKASPY